MEVLILNHAQVQDLLSIKDCIDVMSEALKATTQGKFGTHLRNVMWLPDKKGAIGMMPSFATDLKVMGIKAVSVFPGNASTDLDSHQGAVMLFESQNGRPLAIIDAGSITAIRTPAVSAVATKILAREDASHLALLGAGIQASGHLEALLKVRPIQKVSVWSLPQESARKFADDASRRFDIPVEVAETSHKAVDGADIICTLTPSHEPVLFGSSLCAGTHINAVGSCIPIARELDSSAVVKSRLFVDCIESTINEAGDFLIPKSEGVINDSHILGEIGEILTGKITGRQTKDEITLFKSLGLALEDIASAFYVYKKAIKNNIGTKVELGSKRH